MVHTFHYTFDELEIVPADIIELLGFESGEIPEPFPGLIEQALSEVPEFCSIRGGYIVFDDIEMDALNGTVRINEHLFSPSQIVLTQFKNATQLAVFVGTAGAKISEHAKNIANDGDPLTSYIFDVIGSVTVEKAMEKIKKALKAFVGENGLSISDSFSPGYCEWNVAEQQMLFSLLPENFCGVSLSPSSLMSPIKSVSGIIAIGHGMKQKGYQCHWCSDKTCLYGKIKRGKKAFSLK